MKPLAVLLLFTLVAAVAWRWWSPGPAASAGRQANASVRALLPHQIPGTTLDEPTTRLLLPHLKDATWCRYDAQAIVRAIPDKTDTITWREHPAGTITLSTNNMGFREDAPTRTEPSGPRVVVGGDSHAFGLVDNRDTLANVLERRLSDGDGPAVEVLSAGVSGTGPDEQLALMRVLLDLRPDVYVIVFYEGNDFANTLAFHDFRTKRPMAPIGQREKDMLEAVRKGHRVPLAQALAQAFNFRNRPGDEEVALQAALAVAREMAAACREQGVGFVLALLPAKEDVDEPGPRDPPLRERLGLSAEEAAGGRRLGQRLAAALRDEGLEVVELAPRMREATRPLYWSSDHHLNVDGHAAVAALLEEPVRAALARRRAGATAER